MCNPHEKCGLYDEIPQAHTFMNASGNLRSILAMRGLSALPLVCAYVLWRGQARSLLQIRWKLHLMRGVMSVGMLSLFTFALTELPLTEAYALFCIAPLLNTILSIPVLREKVLPMHWLAIAVGFGGVHDCHAPPRCRVLLAECSGGVGVGVPVCHLGRHGPCTESHGLKRAGGVLDDGDVVVRRRGVGLAALGDHTPRALVMGCRFGGHWFLGRAGYYGGISIRQSLCGGTF